MVPDQGTGSGGKNISRRGESRESCPPEIPQKSSEKGRPYYCGNLPGHNSKPEYNEQKKDVRNQKYARKHYLEKVLKIPDCCKG